MKQNNYALITLNDGGYALKAPDGTDVDLKKHNIDLTGYELDIPNCAETEDGIKIYRFFTPNGGYYALTIYPSGELNGESHSKEKGKKKVGHFIPFIRTEIGYEWKHQKRR